MDNQCAVRTYFKLDPHGNGSGEVEMYSILLILRLQILSTWCLDVMILTKKRVPRQNTNSF